jgi:hypothetical protein
MTTKIYKTAQGQSIDLGAIILRNENVRAVGNMNVNARGDRLDAAGHVLDKKNKLVSRQHERTTRPGTAIPVSTQPLHTSNIDAKQSRATAQAVTDTIPGSGLAAAMARSQANQPTNPNQPESGDINP